MLCMGRQLAQVFAFAAFACWIHKTLQVSAQPASPSAAVADRLQSSDFGCFVVNVDQAQGDCPQEHSRS